MPKAAGGTLAGPRTCRSPRLRLGSHPRVQQCSHAELNLVALHLLHRRRRQLLQGRRRQGQRLVLLAAAARLALLQQLALLLLLAHQLLCLNRTRTGKAGLECGKACAGSHARSDTRQHHALWSGKLPIHWPAGAASPSPPAAAAAPPPSTCSGPAWGEPGRGTLAALGLSSHLAHTPPHCQRRSLSTRPPSGKQTGCHTNAHRFSRSRISLEPCTKGQPTVQHLPHSSWSLRPQRGGRGAGQMRGTCVAANSWSVAHCVHAAVCRACKRPAPARVQLPRPAPPAQQRRQLRLMRVAVAGALLPGLARRRSFRGRRRRTAAAVAHGACCAGGAVGRGGGTGSAGAGGRGGIPFLFCCRRASACSKAPLRCAAAGRGCLRAAAAALGGSERGGGQARRAAGGLRQGAAELVPDVAQRQLQVRWAMRKGAAGQALARLLRERVQRRSQQHVSVRLVYVKAPAIMHTPGSQPPHGPAVRWLAL